MSKLTDWAYDGETQVYGFGESQKHSVAFTNQESARAKIEGALYLLGIIEEWRQNAIKSCLTAEENHIIGELTKDLRTHCGLDRWSK